jgi:hypothetical protein
MACELQSAGEYRKVNVCGDVQKKQPGNDSATGSGYPKKQSPNNPT